jgi:hypothetical protein
MKQPVWRPGSRWDINIKTGVTEMCEDLHSIHVSHNKDQWWVLENMTTDVSAPYNTANFLIMWGHTSFSSRALFRGLIEVNWLF